MYGIKDSDSAASIMVRRRLKPAVKYLLHGDVMAPPLYWELHRNYVIFQEFIPDNDWDVRIWVIGGRARGVRRFNRPNDFRASGSGLKDRDRTSVDDAFVRLAFDIADRLKLQSIAFDFLSRGDQPLVSEMSFTWQLTPNRQSVGYWDRDANWHDDYMPVEMAILDDFIARLEQRRSLLSRT